jgi:hypothetical protein
VRQVLGADAAPVVFDFNHNLVTVKPGAQPDTTAAGCVLDGIFDYGAEGAAQRAVVGVDGRQVRRDLDQEFMSMFGGIDALDLFTGAHDLAGIHRAGADLDAACFNA